MTRKIIEKLLGPEWVDFMAPFMESKEFDSILEQLKALKATGETIFPPQAQIFRAFMEVPLSKVRIVILGMDPYPNEGYASGLAFGHLNNMKKTPSMEKIIEAVESDCYSGLDFNIKDFDTELLHWCKQGILLLNSSLTVKEDVPGSHAAIWKPFTTYFVETMNAVKKDVIWNAWGKQAQSFMPAVNVFTNYVNFSEHPSNAAKEKRAWDTKCFSRTNAIITANSLGDKIKWL